MDAEDRQKEYQRILGAIPPGPWHARGNTVLAGGDTVAVIFARGASMVAQYLSRFPTYLDEVFEGCIETEQELARLRERVEDLEVELETAKSEAKSLREDLAEANNALDDRLAGR